ncbi:DUF1697 domain-containing protein [Cohnella sp. 56]|uniref:DUF1697 domain-containing protein n=1 Tax=Cohnella sp. 56 TaxID=3113722 RepID=UPI0030E9DD1C
MTVHIALLRGINVGGNNKIKMAELKAACEQLGFADVRTYIQSGNVLLRSDRPASEVKKLIEDKLHCDFGVKRAVVLIRSSEEMRDLLDACPYSAEEIAAASQLYVNLLDTPLDAEQAARIADTEAAGERCVVRDKEVYLLLTPSILDSEFAKLFGKMKLPITARNWNTMSKLGELAAQMEA